MIDALIAGYWRVVDIFWGFGGIIVEFLLNVFIQMPVFFLEVLGEFLTGFLEAMFSAGGDW